MNVHACARTTPSLRREIQQSTCPNASWLNNIMSLEPLFRSGNTATARKTEVIALIVSKPL